LIEEQRGHLAEARRMLLALDETAPDSVERLIALGRIEARLGRREAALGHYRRALVLAPDDRRVQRGLAALGEPGR
jgi:cytochrome c-type biogenesis protein CcmH/NrfG